MSPQEQTRNLDPSWRQGSLIPRELITRLDTVVGGDQRAFPDNAIFVLITQDCDIAHQSFEAEPYVEFLVARAKQLEEEDRGAFWGRQPRRFQFMRTWEGRETLFEIWIHDRYRAGREVLLGGLPTERLDQGLSDAICRWVAKRYTRPAFPDEFNRRCRPARDKFANLLKKEGDLLRSLHIRLEPDDEDLGADDDYHLMLFAICSRNVWEDPVRQRASFKLVEQIEQALRRCDGIVIDEARLVPEHRFSLEDVQNTDRWDYDYLTYREGSGVPVDGSLA